MIPRITLSRALSDINLLRAPFQAPSFWTWKTVARLIMAGCRATSEISTYFENARAACSCRPHRFAG